MVANTAGQRELFSMGAETEMKKMDHVVSVFGSSPSTRTTAISASTGAVTQLVSSTRFVPTPSIVENRATITSPEVIQQREQSRVNASRAAASLRRTTEPMSPSQVTVTTTSAVVSGLALEESEESSSLRQIPVSLIALCAEGYIWPGHPDAQYTDVFPSEMSLSQQNRDYRLDPEEGWRLLYPFTEPEVRHLRINTPVNLAHMAKSDAIVEMIQIHCLFRRCTRSWEKRFQKISPSLW